MRGRLWQVGKLRDRIRVTWRQNRVRRDDVVESHSEVWSNLHIPHGHGATWRKTFVIGKGSELRRGERVTRLTATGNGAWVPRVGGWGWYHCSLCGVGRFGVGGLWFDFNAKVTWRCVLNVSPLSRIYGKFQISFNKLPIRPLKHYHSSQLNP